MSQQPAGRYVPDGPPPKAPANSAERLPTKKIIALATVWLAFIVWMVLSGIDAGSIGAGRAGMAWQRPTAQALFYLDVWGVVAALGLLYVRFNPNHWGNILRLTVGTTAIGMMLGRCAGSWVSTWLPATQAPDWVQFLIAPFALSITGASVIVAIALVLGLLFGLLVFVPVVMANQLMQFERQVSIFNTRANGLSAKIVKFVFWLWNEAPPLDPPDESKGARFATAKEVEKALRSHDPKSMIFGYVDKTEIALTTEKHVLIMASTRSGKGVSLIIPHLLRYPGSAFVLDPKGENAKATGRRRAALNKEVHYLDPFGITGKPQSRFNPLSRFTPENMEAESKALAAALFITKEGGNRDHWNSSGQQLIAGLILHVYTAPEIPAAYKDLVTVRQLLLGRCVQTLEAMRESDAADGLLSSLASSFLETPSNERGSIISTAQRQTEILDNPQIAACLRAHGPGKELDFGAWHRGTMTVYLCLSAPKFPTFNRWLRLLLTSALDEMTDRLEPPALPVCFMLDELETLGHLQPVENAIGLAAGYGVQLVSVFQDIAQMKDLYQSRWASFVGNSGIRALFNLDDFDTANYWSRFIGGRLVESRSRKTDQYGMSEGGESISENMRPLLSPEKIMFDFAQGKMLVLAQGLHPVITDRVPYYEIKAAAGLWDDPRLPVKRQAPPKPAAAAWAAAPGRPAPSAAPAPQLVRAAPAPAPAKTPAPARPAPGDSFDLGRGAGTFTPFNGSVYQQSVQPHPAEPDAAQLLDGLHKVIDRAASAERRGREGR